MKNLIIIIVLSHTFLITNGQKCQSSTDAFSGKNVVTFDYKAGTIKFDLEGDDIKLQIKAGYSGDFDFPMEEETPILFKFDNDEVLELKTTEQSIPNTNVLTVANSVVTITNYYYMLSLSRENIERFSSQNLTAIRYPDAHGGTQDLDGKRISRFAKAIKKGSNCMLDNLQK